MAKTLTPAAYHQRLNLAADEPKEKWRALPEASDYEVSDLGRVRSRKGRGRILRPRPLPKGYLRVSIYPVPFVQVDKYIHRLVADAFVSKKDGCDVVNHLDGNRANNAANNLEWTTQKGNIHHSIEVLGNTHRGTKNGCAKLSDQDVIHIRELCANGVSDGKIAKEYSVVRGTVLKIRRNQRWSHL